MDILFHVTKSPKCYDFKLNVVNLLNYLLLKDFIAISGVLIPCQLSLIPNSYISTYQNKRQVRTDNYTMELNFRKVANEIF